ncbi:MAG TPA: hypothetical protein VMI32_19055 [Candidatus Solibacter sp.]|nr:hypothetical protein [Candidatus Solibacter sp.]
MITFFTTAKPFVGHDGIIQRNALQSWKLLHPDIEVILFGDDEGAAEVCAELGLIHEPQVKRHESGAKYLNYMFARAQEIARHNYVCFSNCDIVLFKDFLKAFEIARSWSLSFLAVGRRWDTDVTAPIDFQEEGWDRDLRRLAVSTGIQQDDRWIDFFLFNRGLYDSMPALIVGHCYWDNWMVWMALSAASVPVIDVSRYVTAVHQNHGYNPRFGRSKGGRTDPLSQWNLEAIGGAKHTRTILGATHRVDSAGRIKRNLWHYVPLLRLRQIGRPLLYDLWLPAWHFALGLTRPVRHALGLRSKGNGSRF